MTVSGRDHDESDAMRHCTTREILSTGYLFPDSDISRPPRWFILCLSYKLVSDSRYVQFRHPMESPFCDYEAELFSGFRLFVERNRECIRWDLVKNYCLGLGSSSSYLYVSSPLGLTFSISSKNDACKYGGCRNPIEEPS